MGKSHRRRAGALLEDLFTGPPLQRRRGPLVTRSPDLDLVELPDAFVLRVMLPGVPPEQLDISLVGNHLTIRGQPAPLPGGGAYLRRERPPTPFLRHIPLPTPVDSSLTEAHLENGVLELRLPKRPPPGRHRIRIH
jgi:HSP20 family protein